MLDVGATPFQHDLHSPVLQVLCRACKAMVEGMATHVGSVADTLDTAFDQHRCTCKELRRHGPDGIRDAHASMIGCIQERIRCEARGHRAQPAMPPRTRVTLALLAALVLAAAWAPGTPVFRQWIGDLLRTTAQDAGFELSFSAIEGNAWRGLQLRDPEVSTVGGELRADQVRLRWFLPSLLVGELPLRVEATGLSGQLRFSELDLSRWGTSDAGAVPAMAVRPRLDALRLDGAAIELLDVPFTLPSFAIERLDATVDDDGGIRAELTLRTAEGSLDGVVRGAIGDPELHIELLRGDAMVAHHWWEGVRDGQLSGAMRWGPAGADGRFELQGGALEVFGTRVDHVHGPLVWLGSRVEAVMVGQGLDGRLTAQGAVDWSEDRWWADGDVDVPLSEASAALLTYLEVGDLPAATDGRVTGSMHFEGWTTVGMSGDLRIEDGSYLGETLVSPSLTLSYRPQAGGLAVEAVGRWGQGPFTLSARPEAEATLWAFQAAELQPYGFPLEQVELQIATGQAMTGRARAHSAGPAHRIDVDMVLDAEGLQAYLSGELLGGPVEGAVASPALRADAPMSGALRWTPDPGLWDGAPQVEAEMAGRLGAPLASLSVQGEAAVRPSVLADWASDLDLRGQATAGWDDRGLWLDGRLGPAQLSFMDGRAVVVLDPLAVEGQGIRGTIGPGELSWSPEEGLGGSLATEAGWWAENLVEGTPLLATDGPLVWRLGGGQGAWLAETEQGWQLTWRDGLEARLDEVRLRLLDRPLRLSGAWQDGQATWLAQLDDEALSLRGRWSGDTAEALLASAEQTLTIDWTAAQGAVLRGMIDTAAFATFWPALPVAMARVDAAWLPGEPAPRGTAELSAQGPLPTVVEAVGDGSRVDLAGSMQLPLAPLAFRGAWTPTAAMLWQATADWGVFGPISIDQDGARGQGQLPDQAWLGASLTGPAWTLTVTPDLQADLQVGDSTFRYDPVTNRAVATIDQALAWGETAAVVGGSATWDLAEPSPSIDLRLDLGQGAEASLLGDLQLLELDLIGPTHRWAEAISPVLGERGAATLAGELRGSGRWSADGASLGRLDWSAVGGGQLLRVDLALQGDDWTVQATGQGLSLSADDDGIALRADDFQPDDMVVASPLPWPLRLDGDLGWRSGQWTGDLIARSRDPSLNARLHLRGSGAGLDLSVDATVADGELRGQGRLDTAPWRLEMDVFASYPQPAATADGRLRFQDGQLSFAGEIDVPAAELGPVAWPAFGAVLDPLPGEPWRMSGTGALLGDTVTGMRLPLDTQLGPLLLSSGPLADELAFELQGDDLRASLSGRWSGWVLHGLYGEGDEALALRLDGAGTKAQGGWTVGDPIQPWLSGTAMLDETGIELGLRAADLHPERRSGLGVGPWSQADGDLSLRLDGDGLRADGRLDLALPLTADGAPWSLELAAAGRAMRVAVSAEVAGASLAAEAATADFMLLPTQGVDLAAEVAGVPASGGLRPLGDGSWWLQLVTDDGGWDLQGLVGVEGHANLRGPSAEERVEVRWSSHDDGMAVELRGGLFGVEADGLLRFADGVAPELVISAAHASSETRMRLEGPVAPLALSGELSTMGGAIHPLRLKADPALEATWGGLRFRLQDGSVHLSGRSSAGQLPYLGLQADGLAWGPAAGWSGRAELSSEPLPIGLSASAELTGAGELLADVTIRRLDEVLGGARLQLPADPLLPWSGEVALDLPLDLGDAAPAAEGGWRLAASGPVAGRLVDPTLDLALVLTGPRAAHGRASWAGGRARLDLLGQGLTLSGSWRDGAGQGHLDLQSVELLELLPWIDQPSLDLRADLSLGTDGLQLWVERLSFTTPGGSIEGSGSWQPVEGPRGWLRTDLDLGDLRLGPALAGRVDGMLLLTPSEAGGSGLGQVEARWGLHGLSATGLGATLQGELQASGDLADPLLRGSWLTHGQALKLDGGFSWYPLRSAFELLAAGRVMGATVDLDLARSQGLFTGQGSVVTEDSRWTLRADGQDLVLQGGEGWSDWVGRLSPGPWRLALAGDLADLPNASGTWRADLSLAGEEGPSLALDVTGLDVFGLLLQDLSLQGSLAEGWRLEGSRLNADLSADLQDWRAELAGLPLPLGDLVLDLSAGRDEGTVGGALHLRGSSAWGPVDLSGGFHPNGEGWQGRLDGLLFGGSVDWPLRLTEDGWSGEGRIDGAELAGQTLTARWDLSGELLDPVLQVEILAADDAGLDSQAGLGWQLSGRLDSTSAVVQAELDHPDGGRVGLRGRAWPDVDLILDGGAGDVARLRGGWTDGQLQVDGRTELRLGPVALELSAIGGLRLALDGTEGGLRAALPTGSIAEVVAAFTDRGLTWVGEGDWVGEALLRFPSSPLFSTEGLRLSAGDLTLDLRGQGGLDAAAFDIGVGYDRPPAALAEHLPERLDGRLLWDGQRLELLTEAPWQIALALEPAARSASLAADLRTMGGRLHGVLSLDDDGWQGQWRSDGLEVQVGEMSAEVEVSVRGRRDHVELEATVAVPRGVLGVTGRWDAAMVRPAGWGVAGPPRSEADLRLVGLDLAGLGGASALEGVLGGNAALRGDVVVGQFTVAGLTLGEWSTPASLGVQANLAGDDGPQGTLRLDMGSSSAVVDLDTEGIAAFLRLESFPLQELVNATLGPIDVVARVTGVGRAAWAWGQARPLDLRIATETVHLERAGVVTTGNVAFNWDGESLEIGEAFFEGRGSWRAQGSATPERIDLELVASDADFDPLLGLVPMFVRYGVSAGGSLRLTAQGTLSAPDIQLSSDGLELGVAGTRYRLDDLALDLSGTSWSGQATVQGVAPLGGLLELSAGGQARLWPSPSFSLSARASGDLDVPLVGRVANLEAGLDWAEDQAGDLVVSGTVGGAAARVEGRLSPLDLRVRGQGMRLSLPTLFVAEAVLDADLRLLAGDGYLSLSGRLDGSQALADIGAPGRARAQAAGSQGQEPSPAEIRASAEALERFRFDGVRIVVPQRVLVNETFANAEASVDLTLVGTAGTPRLAGTVTAIRGTIRFAGRDLDIVHAVLSFDPTVGLFPSISVDTRTTFEKIRVLPTGSDARFAAPAGPTFTVDVGFSGQSAPGPDGLSLDLSHHLSSDALVEGLGGVGARPLSDMELLTLVTLGRLNVDGALAGTVAQSALDTAIDMLITAELQAALAEALGIEVVELRTSPVSSLFDGSDPFGVSLRLGAYLSEEVFASYRLSTLDGSNGQAGVTNELLLNYQLGPVAIGLSGRIDMAADRSSRLGPVPSLSLDARYGFAPGWSLELGVDLSTERSGARLGVTWRW